MGVSSNPVIPVGKVEFHMRVLQIHQLREAATRSADSRSKQRGRRRKNRIIYWDDD